MAFTWQDDCIELLRVLINDMDEEPTYNNERLVRVLIAAAFTALKEASFSQSFVVNLICLKAACIIDTGAAILAVNNSVVVKDMVFSADLKETGKNALALLEKGYCKTYEGALDSYLYGNSALCAAVMGPFRTMAFPSGRPGDDCVSRSY